MQPGHVASTQSSEGMGHIKWSTQRVETLEGESRHVGKDGGGEDRGGGQHWALRTACLGHAASVLT